LTAPEPWSRTAGVKINGVKGMNDILPGQVGRWQEIERVSREVFALHGYREVRTPVVEPYALYARGVGETTDIVNKEMYVFEDKGEDKLALRPEGTAGTVRAYIEHGAHVEGPQKWFYVGPMFRRERPQKGRYRQFHQIGVEAFGIAEPAIDVEQIAMLADLFRRLGVAPVVHVNSVGDAACRPAYLEELRGWLRARGEALCADCRERTEKNPLRVLDCKVPSCQPVLAEAPRLLERLCDGCRAHLDAVRQGLDDLSVPYLVNPRLVRGLDYYVRTAYEFTSDALGSQSAVAGGGRYDGLVETLGGPPTPGIGFGRGEERLALMLEAVGRPVPASRPAVFFVSADEAGRREGLRRATELRRAGIACDLDARGGKLARQFKQAERVGARFALVLGANEVASGQAKLKDMVTREEIAVALGDLASRLGPGPT
jgi:histidyl-tRNA synthetase